MKPIDLVGQRFGRLVVLAREGTRGRRKAAWRCRCDCGRETIQRGDHLRRGAVTSCGCARVPHGHARNHSPSPTFRSWSAMISRCTYPTTSGYERYGGRGIKVCQRWSGEHGFEAFLADMGDRPAGKTLDRVDGAKGYKPGNCRWATAKEQRANRTHMARRLSA